MTRGIGVFTLVVILSNPLVENVEVQSTEISSSYNVQESLESLRKAVESLQVKVESQTIALNKLEAKVDTQEALLKNLATTAAAQANLLNNLETKEKWQQPVAQSPTNRTLLALEGNDIAIWCFIRGTPSPEIRWTRENGTLASDRVVIGNNGNGLRIKNVQLSDEGTYVCVAANGVGAPASQSVRLEVYGPAQQCHRMIESDTGSLEIERSSTSCLWVIKLKNTTGFRLQFDPRMMEPILVIGEPNYSALKIHPFGSNQTFHEYEGKSLAIVAPPRLERTTLNWTGFAMNDSEIVSSNTKYVNDSEGTLQWETALAGNEGILWAFVPGAPVDLNWTLSNVFTAQDQENLCKHFSFSVWVIKRDGNVSEIQKYIYKLKPRVVFQTCDGSSEGSLELQIRSQVLILLKIESAEAIRSKLRVSWTLHGEPLKRIVDGIIAGTFSGGAFVVPFNSSGTRMTSSGWIMGLTFDWNSHKIYYLHTEDGIKRSNLDGSESEILSSDSRSLFGMTIEPTTGNLYISNRTSSTISVCNNDANKCSTISNSSASDFIYDIAVHRSKGLLFWSNSNKKLVRANLDGSNEKIILEGHTVQGIDVDEPEDRIYWGSTVGIGSCDLNGEDVRMVLNVNTITSDVAIYNDRVYYADYGTSSINSISKSGTNSRMVANRTSRSKIMHIDLIGLRVSNQPANPCEKSNCAHLCVLVDRWSYRCTCPDNRVLKADGKTCTV